MTDLITSTRAKYNIAQASFSSDENSTIGALITACSKAIRRTCRREFDSQQFDELYNGDGSDRLLLRQFPVISVARVAHDPTTVLRVTNTSASNQRATVAVTANGLTLVRVAAGVVTIDSTITFAGHVTINALKTAIDALGNGWSATIPDSSFGSRASADLRAVQGAHNASDAQADLKIHVRELSSYEIDPEAGWLLRRGGWGGGPNYWRVVYTAGYATVPEDVQEACASWVAALYWQTKRDPGLASESVAGAGARVVAQPMPPHVARLLLPYRDHKLTGG